MLIIIVLSGDLFIGVNTQINKSNHTSIRLIIRHCLVLLMVVIIDYFKIGFLVCMLILKQLLIRQMC